VAFLSLERVITQHLDGTGNPAPGWTADGTVVTPTTTPQDDPRVIADGYGGAIVTWSETRAPTSDIFAQQLFPNGATPVAVSMIRAVAEPDHVTIEWQLSSASATEAHIYRRSPEGERQSLGSVVIAGSDPLTFDDTTVRAGERYAYCLGYRVGGIEQFSAETWINVPLDFGLTLEGLRPNPAAGPASVSFSLPDDSPAKLSGFDIAGRQVLDVEVGSLGRGHHLVPLSDRALKPGVYIFRLQHLGGVRTMRGFVLK